MSVMGDWGGIKPGSSQGWKRLSTASTRKAAPTTCEKTGPSRPELLHEDHHGHRGHGQDVHDAQRDEHDHQPPAAADAVRPVVRPDP